MTSKPTDSKSDDIVVFEILRDSACAECGEHGVRRPRTSRLLATRRRCPECRASDETAAASVA